jgi:transcriptional regulator with XRE-family HTH domain
MTREGLKRARKQLGMTQRQLAEALGMQRVSIARMEIGLQPIMTTTELAVKYLVSKTRKGK